MHRFPHIFVSLTALLVLFAAPTSAAVTPAQRCTAAKLSAAARATIGHLACHAQAIRKGTAVSAACHATADGRLDAAFARIEAGGGCQFVGDVGAVDAAIDELVDALVAGATSGRCGATKLRAAGRKAFNDLACHVAAVRHGDELAPACQDRALTRFLATFADAEKRFACGTNGDAPIVQAFVDDFVDETAARLIEGTSPVDGAPADLAAVVVGSEVQIQWTAPPAPSGNTHVRVLRRLDVAPVDAADALATVVFFGTASAATDALTALLPTTATTPRTYHYAAFGCTAGGTCEPVGSRTTLAPTLLQVLKGGGYTMYFRHASATVCVDNTLLGPAATTSVPDWWKSCDAVCATATARQLDATGVTQATTIGQGFDTVAIPVNRVIASEFCRTKTTAELMDLGPPIELNQGITFFVYDEPGRCAAAQALLAVAPAAGGNTAIIGHAGFTCDVLGTLAMGEGAIFKPDGLGGSLFIARQQPSTWAGLQ